METSLLLNTSMLLTLTVILTPMLLPLLPKKLKNSPATITHTFKKAFLISFVPTTLFMYSGTESITSC